jgi:hypothetical protein
MEVPHRRLENTQMQSFITAPIRRRVGLVLGPLRSEAARRTAAVAGRAVRRGTPTALGAGGGR